MQHRIQLSTQLVIATKAVQRTKVKFQPSVVGINVNPYIAGKVEKSLHSVDLDGNIIQFHPEEEFAA